MKPPYSITSDILSLVASVSEKLGAVNASRLQVPRTELRKANRIRTIQSTLGIEGNTLQLDQVTAILEHKRVVAPKKDILEVKNAIKVYNAFQSFDPRRMDSLLKSHALLMEGLVKQPGKFRASGAGIAKGSVLSHMAPDASMVHGLMKDLFDYLKKDKDPVLIRSCVFHYELEFIHPFEDGNGRMGRLWQSLLLTELNPVFAFLPVEAIIKQRQEGYYRALEQSDKEGQSTAFIIFMLNAIDAALIELLDLRRPPLTTEERISIFKSTWGKESFSRKNYMDHFKEISAPTASRDLRWAVMKNILLKEGDKRNTLYQFV
jgi:Fic family protein